MPRCAPPQRRRRPGLRLRVCAARASCRASRNSSRHTPTNSRACCRASTARPSAMRAARSRAGLEVVEFACGAPHLLKGEYSEKRRHGRRCVQPAPAARRCRRDHAVQFPRHGPDVDVSDGARLRQHVRVEAVGARPVGSHAPRGAHARGGIAAGVLNVVNGDKTAVDAILAHPGIAAVSFVGSTPVAKHVYLTGHRGGQARPGARRREESHGRDARREPRPSGRSAGRRGLWVGRRTLHGDLGRGCGGRRGRRSGRRAR
jgi:hypothetical protein